MHSVPCTKSQPAEGMPTGDAAEQRGTAMSLQQFLDSRAYSGGGDDSSSDHDSELFEHQTPPSDPDEAEGERQGAAQGGLELHHSSSSFVSLAHDVRHTKDMVCAAVVRLMLLFSAH